MSVITGKYGTFSDEQFEQFKKKLHSKVHWLLLYKEKGNCDFYEKYFTDTMKYFNSLNTVLANNEKVIDVLVVLQIAFDEVHKKDFDFKAFKKEIFEAHNIIDRM
jgi:hypothetical protein